MILSCGVPVRQQDVSGQPAGKYFGFDTNAWNQFFGSEAVCNADVNARQCRDGKEVWQGPISVCSSNSIGRKGTSANPQGGQWQANDYLVKEDDTCSCVCAGVGVSIRQQDVSGQPAGKYFGFDINAWKQFFGSDAQCGADVNAKQCRDGKEVWRGPISVCDTNSIGRRAQSADPEGEQWEAGDTLVKEGDACSSRCSNESGNSWV